MYIKNSAIQLIALPAFTDNYIWMLHDGNRCLVVDPGDAQVVQAALLSMELTLDTILITHHHSDHTGGVSELRDATGCKVWGPQRETMPEPISRVGDGGRVQVLGLTFQVIDVPGHTAGHTVLWRYAFFWWLRPPV
jgi:hydroxyacylglutathione hydrolase